MTPIVSLIMLAFAVSLDSFNVGLTYGMRNMKIPLKSVLIIALCSVGSLLTGMFVGKMIGAFFSSEIADRVGGLILVFLGLWVLYQLVHPNNDKEEKERILLNFEIASLGLVIHILKKPLSADIDQSGTITGLEAFLLGLALSLDAFGAGVGAAMLGFSPLWLAIYVSCMSTLFVLTGLSIGRTVSEIAWMKKLSFLPGLLLIFLGLIKM
ncbi:sporulation membrane protein YtaF [Aeribacillus pallidus]|jgi:putative sporulation protein YtaF|uniref:sporulation membrane protein YtaF n=1 Tax=Aeribacillus pallidus TaxID=33936 RepID=UPI003D22F42B